MFILPTVPAQAQRVNVDINIGQQERYVGDQCRRHPDWRGCDDFRRGHRHWDRDDYNDWYGWNRPSLGGAAAGIFGFAIGSAIGAAAANNDDYDDEVVSEDDDHIAACQDRFKSYNVRTDTYLGYDGKRHICTL